MLSLFMKKYTLMIVYDEDKDQIVEMDQKLVDLQPAKVVKVFLLLLIGEMLVLVNG